MEEGQHHFVLSELPYEERALASAHKCRYYKGIGWVYTGVSLPEALKEYAAAQYTWGEWVQKQLNGLLTPGNPDPDTDTGTITLEPDQAADVEAVREARQAGAPEFLVANDVGTGKTVVGVAAAKALPAVANILVVCPKSVIPGWRHHVRMMGDGGKNWVFINYESILKLLDPPASAVSAKKRRTKNRNTARHGTPKVAWDLVISDESHNRGNPDAQRSLAVDRVINGPGPRPAFTLNLSATAGANPAKLAYLHRGFAWRTGGTIRPAVTAKDYVAWCQQYGIKVSQSGYGDRLAWERNTADLKKIQTMLFTGYPTWGVRRLAPWDEPRRIPTPVALSPKEKAAYETEWQAFKPVMEQLKAAQKAHEAGTPESGDMRRAKENGLAATLRYRQKIGMIKANGVAEFIKDKLVDGFQVAVSCQFTGTVEAIAEALEASKIPVALFTGQNADTRETDREQFQTGTKPVILFTPTDGFNLQANDSSVPGASTAPRITVVAEQRSRPEQSLQAEGRCHRNHQIAPVFYVYAENTIEDRDISTSVEKMKDLKTMHGDPLVSFDGLSKALHLPTII